MGSLLQRLRWDVSDEAAVNSRDPAVMARTFTYLYGAGGTLVLLTLALPHSSDRWLPGVLGPALCALIVAVTIAVGFDRLPQWLFFALPPLGAALVSVAIYSGGSATITAYAGLYFWVALAAFSFFSMRTALLNLAWIAALYAAVLAATPEAGQVVLRWVMVIGTLTVAALVIAALRERVERLVEGQRRRSLKQQKVAELGRRSVAGADLKELSELAVTSLTEALSVEYAAVWEETPDSEELMLKAVDGWEGDASAVVTVPRDDPLVRRALHSSEAALAKRHDLPTTGTGGEPQQTSSGIGVAIRGPSDSFGVLAAYSREERAFTATEADFMQAIAHVLGDTVERRRTEESVRHAALHDQLTGRPNRSLFMDRLQEALIRHNKADSLVAVYFLDIDDFKLVNEGFGHSAGDELLRAFGPRLRAALVMTDTVARFGGDEFAVLCEGVRGEKHALEIAERILGVVAEPFKIAGAGYRVSASVGVALSGDKGGPEELIAHADAAMYLAKERSRGGYEFFDSELRHRVRLRLQFESALRSAPDDDQLHLVMQPIVSLPEHHCIGSEVLLRWRHPDLGPVSPAEFIPVAEETGAIIPIGDWVLDEAFSLAARLRGDPNARALLPMHVNLSLRQLAQPDFTSTIREKIARTGARIRDIGFEITEHALLNESSGTIDTLTELQEMGFSIVLDDFGTGYSSLSHLKHFPLDAVKIDRLFVSNLISERKDEAIVEAVIGMADAFALDVIAEGIETPAQARRLAQLGCRLGQGFLFSKPLPPQELELSGLLASSADSVSLSASSLDS
jgi:diguanylate cyclase (GGDEF)-like protein